MDKRKAAEIILNKIDQNAPVTINRNLEQRWLNAIMIGLTEIEKGEQGRDGERRMEEY